MIVVCLILSTLTVVHGATNGTACCGPKQFEATLRETGGYVDPVTHRGVFLDVGVFSHNLKQASFSQFTILCSAPATPLLGRALIPEIVSSTRGS